MAAVTKPYGTAKVDWASPLSRGLSFLLPFTEGSGAAVDIVGRQKSTQQGAWGIGRRGRKNTVVSQATSVAFNPDARTMIPNDMDWAGLVVVDTTGMESNWVVPMGACPTQTQPGEWMLQSNNGTDIAWFRTESATNCTYINFVGAWPTVPGLHTFLVCRKKGTTGNGAITLWVDGNKYTGSEGGTLSWTASIGTQNFGVGGGGSLQTLYGGYYICALWQNRTFTDGEARQLIANPWQILKAANSNRVAELVKLPSSTVTLTGTDTYTPFASVGSINAVAALSGSDTVASYSSLGAITVTAQLSGADTYGSFSSTGLVNLPTGLTGADYTYNQAAVFDSLDVFDGPVSFDGNWISTGTLVSALGMAGSGVVDAYMSAGVLTAPIPSTIMTGANFVDTFTSYGEVVSFRLYYRKGDVPSPIRLRS